MMYKRKTRKYKLVRKPKGSHRAYKEWAPSVKILQQNINRILPELYMQLLEILPKFNSPTAFLGTLDMPWSFFPLPWEENLNHPLQSIPLYSPTYSPGWQGELPLWEADIVHFLLKYTSTEKYITGQSMHLLCKEFDRTHYDNFFA